ncbi:cytochrome P450 [Heliocybe sulcata]|uniref:Cytochrome P450 n=1 Tax=Heliocybe sulcata TaxID=5364 RepID=A0A5C3N303_9AGAM|nr:cytochrome P450 [Heliocybe sulcata]
MSYLVLAPLLLTLYLLWQRIVKRSKPLPLPPGPQRQPIIGNLLDMPRAHPWLTYARWGQEYGDVFSLDLMGKTMVIVGSSRAATDIFEKHSTVYSDRPHSVMLMDLMKYDWNFGLHSYGSDVWRDGRRVFQQAFGPSLTPKYHPIILRETRTLLRRISFDLAGLNNYLRLAYGAMIIDAVYGIRVHDRNNRYIRDAELQAEGFSTANVPGDFLVAQLPLLKYVPSWFPGAAFKRRAAQWQQYGVDMVNNAFEKVKDTMAQGEANSSIVAELIARAAESERPEEEEDTAKNAMAVAYGGQITLSATQVFILAMAMHPDIRKRAQAEIDSVVGTDRFPDFPDRPNLPYLNAIIKETLRWQPALPIGIPHASSTDSIHNGHFIPKGSVVIGNTWSILHDPRVYANPDEFKPERFLDAETRAPDAAFGYGRRICPGRWFGEAALYSVASHILAAYTVEPPLDSDGQEIELTAEMTSGVVSYPVPYSCRMTPRSEVLKAMIAEDAE